MSRHIDHLLELTEAVNLAGSLSSAGGRYARSPNYTKASSPSSRPSSDRGSTFHFAHKAMSKKSDISDSNFTHTTSAAHQGYIERPSASEEIEDSVRVKLLEVTESDESVQLFEGFSYPLRTADDRTASFGTLGNTKSERKQFWNNVELSERKNGRVQNRIIAELPHELNVESRCLIARDFCQSFEDRKLPYWATIHAPGKRNDDRNFHLHITYYDRPCGRDSSGAWDFSILQKKKKKSRHIYYARPFQNNKHPDTRSIAWPKRLRRNYADACNFYLSFMSFEKRYDPRSYKDSGINKEPTEHLGTKISALESMGLDTEAGQRNAKREIRWRFARAESPWLERVEAIMSPEPHQTLPPEAKLNSLMESAGEGITHARKSASLDIVADLMTHRLDQRQLFLDKEISRLNNKKDISDLARRSSIVVALSGEREILIDRAPYLQLTAKKCKKKSLSEMTISNRKKQEFDRELAAHDPTLMFTDEIEDDFSEFSEVEPTPSGIDDLNANDLDNINDLFKDLDIPSPEILVAPDSESKEDNHADKHISRIADVIKLIAAEPVDDSQSTDLEKDQNAFPGAWSIQSTHDRERLSEIDLELSQLDNRSLRNAAIATRDAADLASHDNAKGNYTRGWSVLRYEARRRGLDIDTGIHEPESGSDEDRARLHTDQDPCPVRVIRKDIARQWVRS